MGIDYTDPLTVWLPHNFNNINEYPTEIMANRFQAWRTVIRNLVLYLREYSGVQEEIVRQQVRLEQAASSAVATSKRVGMEDSHGSGNKEDIIPVSEFFSPVGSGSVLDFANIFTQFHQRSHKLCSQTLAELNSVIIPKLEDLRKDLVVKIKEIKNLQGNFNNNLAKEVVETRSLISQYKRSLEISRRLERLTTSHNLHESDVMKNDPYLVKIRLDRQLRRQITEEHYLHEAFVNLQSAGQKLESIVVLEVQNYLSTFVKLLNSESTVVPLFLVPSINQFLAKGPESEWVSFIEKRLPKHISSDRVEGHFIDLQFPMRKVSDLSIRDYSSSLNYPVRKGYLERRSKYLKSYSSGWYVLTSSYLHEFKTLDRKKDQQPVVSLLLDSCYVSEHSKDDIRNHGAYKFVLSSKLPNGIMHRKQNWVFRAASYGEMIEWYEDLKSLTSLPNPTARANFISRKFKLDEKKDESRASSVFSSSLRPTATNASAPSKNSDRKQLLRDVTLRTDNTASSTLRLHDGSLKLGQNHNLFKEETKSPSVTESSRLGLLQPQHQRDLSAYLPSNMGQEKQYFDPSKNQLYALTPMTQRAGTSASSALLHPFSSSQDVISGTYLVAPQLQSNVEIHEPQSQKAFLPVEIVHPHSDPNDPRLPMTYPTGTESPLSIIRPVSPTSTNYDAGKINSQQPRAAEAERNSQLATYKVEENAARPIVKTELSQPLANT